MSDKWTTERIKAKMDWEGMPYAIEWVHFADIEDPKLAELWKPMEYAYMDYDDAKRRVMEHLDESSS